MNTATAKSGIVLFDGNCIFCQKSVALLRKLDWLGKVDIRDCNDPANWPATDQPLKMDRLLEEMHLVVPGGHATYAGYDAIRWLSWRLPATWLMAPFLYIPGVPWLGKKLYLWVARNRYKIIPCADGVCAVPRKTR